MIESESLDALVDSLLFEGYALYPYTSTATKNATPTPFGIVYPPAYAASLSAAFDHLELRCALEAPPQAHVTAEVRFLAATGRGHEAVAHRLEMPEASSEMFAVSPGGVVTARYLFGAESMELAVSCQLSLQDIGDGRHELTLRVENRTSCPSELDRVAALRRSLISTHPLVRVSAGHFISPLECPRESVNTFPVLATESDDVVLGGAIVLPDHPQIALESHGGMFDATEIEEALLLHVQTLSDAEREQIERDDWRVREMIERASAVTAEEVLALHGRIRLSDKEPVSARESRSEVGSPGDAARLRGRVNATPLRGRVNVTPPREPVGLRDPSVGETEVVVDGVRLRRGGKVRLRPGANADLHARLLDGRTATIERILIDYDGKPHLGVTIDGDPGQELLRETGRLLFFFAPEVEVLDA